MTLIQRWPRRYTDLAAILKEKGVCDTKVSFKDSTKIQLRKSFWSSLGFIIFIKIDLVKEIYVQRSTDLRQLTRTLPAAVF